jgi:NADH-quinone oxidoreductase subunit L
VTVPLILLAIPSIVIGYMTIGPVLFTGWLSESITVFPANDVLAHVGEHFHGPLAMAKHSIQSAPFWLMIAGFVLATFIYQFRPAVADFFQQKLPGIYRLLDHKYYFDELYQKIFISRFIRIGNGLWSKVDAGVIDGWMVNGSARLVDIIAARVRLWQSGYLFQYAFVMIAGLIGILAFWVML